MGKTGRTPMDSAEHLRKLQWQIASLYADHHLFGEEYWDDGRGARWLIGEPESSNMLSEIIAGICGSLIVHGDCDTSRFAYYSDYKDAWHRLRWMALCTDVDYYVAQKASIGMRAGNGGQAYDEEVAKHDLVQRVAEEKASEFHNAELVEVLQEAADGWTEDERELRRFLSEHDKGWDLWECSFGRVVDTHVVVGHLALQRCCYLLMDKYGEEGPPQCRGDRRRK
jgi:hypothetical protein